MFPWQRNISLPWRRKWASLKLREKGPCFTKSSGDLGHGGWRSRQPTRHLEDVRDFRLREAGEAVPATRHLEDVQLGNKEPGPLGTPGLTQRRTGVMENVASVQLCPDPQRQRPLRPLGASLTRTGPGCLGQGHKAESFSRLSAGMQSITLHVEKDVTDPHSVSCFRKGDIWIL